MDDGLNEYIEYLQTTIDKLVHQGYHENEERIMMDKIMLSWLIELRWRREQERVIVEVVEKWKT